MIHALRILILCKSRNYARAVGCFLIQIMAYRSKGHPIYALFRDNCVLFNEELGEISLGHLVQTLRGDPLASDCDHVSELYILLGRFRQNISSYFDSELNGNRPVELADLDTPAGKQVVAFLHQLIARCQTKVFRAYGPNMMEWKNAVVSERGSVHALLPRVIDCKVSSWKIVSEWLGKHFESLRSTRQTAELHDRLLELRSTASVEESRRIRSDDDDQPNDDDDLNTLAAAEDPGIHGNQSSQSHFD